jgi:hypothetical protein
MTRMSIHTALQLLKTLANEIRQEKETKVIQTENAEEKFYSQMT